jgi:hypothetical protein
MKPKWMSMDVKNIPSISYEADAVFNGYEKGWYDALEHLLKYLRDNSWYTKIIPQGKGKRIISKRVGINSEFVEGMLKQLEELSNDKN